MCLNSIDVTKTESDLEMELSDHESAASFTLSDAASETAEEIAMGTISAIKTFRILYFDLAKYMLPIVAVYFLHNVLLTAYIATSYEVIDEETGLQDLSLKKVYQYFILSARIGVFVGKASPTFFHIKQFYVLPFFYIFGMIYSMMLAYAPELMHFFIFDHTGHWISWIIAVPLGFAYGATCMCLCLCLCVRTWSTSFIWSGF